MSEAPRYSTLRDYLALLRRQLVVVLAVALAVFGAALAYSLSQEKTYETEASTSFRDISQDLRLFGVNVPSDATQLQQAGARAEEATSLSVAEAVKKRLKTSASARELEAAVDASVGVQTGFVVIEATWDEPRFVADLANEFAEVSVARATREVENSLDRVIERLEEESKGAIASPTGVVDLGKVTSRQQLVSLKNLREVVDPAEVSQAAQVPSAPTSPNVARDGVLGAIVGLTLGLLAGFVRDSLDRRIRSAKDAHEFYDKPVLGRIGKSALGSTGAARPSPASRYLSPVDLESFRILRTNMAALDFERPPRSVMVTSGLPQEGKSTVAASLAAASAAAGQRTLLVDADLRRPVLASRLAISPEPGLAEYLAGIVSPRETLRTVPLAQRKEEEEGETADSPQGPSLVCMPAGQPPENPTELLASARCHDFVQKVTKAYDLVIFDTSPLLSTADPLELLPHVEGTLICVRLSESTREEAAAVREAFRLHPERPTGLVVTGAGPSDHDYGYYGY